MANEYLKITINCFEIFNIFFSEITIQFECFFRFSNNIFIRWISIDKRLKNNFSFSDLKDSFHSKRTGKDFNIIPYV